MSNVFKWLYKLGHDHARNEMLRDIEHMQDWHFQQSRIAQYRNEDKFDKPKWSREEHQIASNTLRYLLEHFDPKKYPNIEKYLEKLL